MTTAQVEYTEEELLSSHPFVDPLVAGGVVCHGGFDDEGRYISPRTLHRVPAIEAWQAQHAEQFGTALLDIPLETWPAHYPNIAQARYLVEQGVAEPIIATLTRIGTVEGFGAMLRYSAVPDLQQCFDEEITGTAMTHLTHGLFEAHARDEAGFEDQGGHKQMWFTARDVAFENPVTEDETMLMLERMGIATPGSGGSIDLARLRAEALASRALPDDIDFDLESVIDRMTRLVLIEISAFHAFAWAEELLADTDLFAGEGEAARLISYVRADETPHVEYLKTVLSEMRDRTFVGSSGRKHAGAGVIATMWDRAVADSLGSRRLEQLKLVLREVERAVEARPNGADILHRFHELGTIRPGADGEWITAEVAA